ncbi:MAG TPA: DNA polymerase IV [Leptospiraceae bacterium]|nr:DNA polymerase IV [Leptospiraceae bacterium]
MDESRLFSRKIIHLDMDAFYASVEERDFPEYRGKPVVISGPPDSRSVVCTANYEARKYGIRSAMPSRQAFKLCPNALFIYPRFQVYKEVSKKIRNIFYEYTDLVEPMGLDEAYMDVTQNKKNYPYAMTVAREIKQRILEETGLTSSVGISYGKFLAKIASDYNKPNGFKVILPEEAVDFISALPIGKFYGIGKVTEKKMLSLGIKNGADLRERPLEFLQRNFGKAGGYYYRIVRGLDTSEVCSYHERKSLGTEDTFEKDISTEEEAAKELIRLSDRLFERADKDGVYGRTITLKIKYSDFTLVTRSKSRKELYSDKEDAFRESLGLFRENFSGKKIRLLGISFSNLGKEETENEEMLFTSVSDLQEYVHSDL